MWTGSLSIRSLPPAERGGNHHHWERDGQKKSENLLVCDSSSLDWDSFVTWFDIVFFWGVFYLEKTHVPHSICVPTFPWKFLATRKKKQPTSNIQNSKGSQQPA